MVVGGENIGWVWKKFEIKIIGVGTIGGGGSGEIKTSRLYIDISSDVTDKLKSGSVECKTRDLFSHLCKIIFTIISFF